MPISKSAKRALRNAENKASANRHRKEIIRETLKTASGETLNKAYAVLDKAAKWGIYHPNKANRIKSRLAKSAVQEAAAPAKKKVSPRKPRAKKA